MGRFYLKHIHMQAFGRFSDKTVGAFSPGLNVVYGKNEAGKTTAAAFVRGVLFGWEDARGSKNVYKPAAAARAGSLVFYDKKTGETAELFRIRNADGLQAKPDAALHIVRDMDKGTYSTIFALTSDELRGLDDAGAMASSLLTAGSGTKESPASALAALDARIATFMSRAAAQQHSLPNIKQHLDECKVAIAAAREQSDAFKRADTERAELAAHREATARELAEANARVETLTTCRADLSRLAEQEADARTRLDRARRNEAECEEAVRAVMPCTPLSGLPMPSLRDESALREALEEGQASRLRLEHRLEAAQDDFEAARARFDAAKASPSSRASSRGLLAALAVAAAAFGIAGIALIVAGAHDNNGLLGIGGVASFAAAAFIAAALLLLAREKKQAGSAEECEHARRVMIEKKSILEARETDMLAHGERIKALLVSSGFEACDSPRRAIEAIDAARTARFSQEAASARLEEARRHVGEARRSLEDTARLRAQRLARAGFSADAAPCDVEAAAIQASQRRDELTDALERLNRRIGELGQMLASAQRTSELDVLKTEHAQLLTRQRESGMELARMLLARRLLVSAIRSWESESQPEVYARASELFSRMTHGVWSGVSLCEGSSVAAVDALGRTWEPRLLSLGTCQQMYLALRIALLECAKEAGASLPVLADDILVNFDDERRCGAIAALAELAQKRQVIIFTCHREIVDLIGECAGGHTLLEL